MTLYQFTYTKHDERALESRHPFEGEVAIVACKTQAIPYASRSHITFERGVSSHTAPQRAIVHYYLLHKKPKYYP